MPHALTATGVQRAQYENHIRMESLRQRLTEKRETEAKYQIRQPNIAVLGFHDYLLLKAEVLRSVAEVVPLDQNPLTPSDDSSSPYNLLPLLNQAGVECFAWNGMVIVAAKSSACCGVFFL